MNKKYFLIASFIFLIIVLNDKIYCQNINNSGFPSDIDTVVIHEGKCIKGNCKTLISTKEYTKADILVDVGYIYQGNFVNGIESGKGTLLSKDNKKIYEGNWKNGLYSGLGKLYLNTGNVFEGNFKYGLMHGKGKTTDKTGKIITNINYKYGKMDGEGVYTDIDGLKYVGSFADGLQNGKGIIYSSDNKIKFDGQWKVGKRNGFGTLYFNDMKYVGDFNNDLFQGKGKLFDKNNRMVYEGDFMYGKIQGKGTFHYENGDSYIGSFENGKRSGDGTTFYKDKTFQKGTWNGDSLYKTISEDYKVETTDYSVIFPIKPFEKTDSKYKSFECPMYDYGKKISLYIFTAVNLDNVPSTGEGQFNIIDGTKVTANCKKLTPSKFYFKGIFPCQVYYWKYEDGTAKTFTFIDISKKKLYLISFWWHENSESTIDKMCDKFMENIYISGTKLR